jgi:hypothetical protein
MRWDTWLRKLGRGILAAAAAAAVTYAITQVTDLMKSPDAPLWIALTGTMILHLLGQLGNMAKHWNDEKV